MNQLQLANKELDEYKKSLDINEFGDFICENYHQYFKYVQLINKIYNLFKESRKVIINLKRSKPRKRKRGKR